MTVKVDVADSDFTPNDVDYDADFIMNLIVSNGLAKAPLEQALDDAVVGSEPVGVEGVELSGVVSGVDFAIRVKSPDVAVFGVSEAWQLGGDTKYRVQVE